LLQCRSCLPLESLQSIPVADQVAANVTHTRRQRYISFPKLAAQLLHRSTDQINVFLLFACVYTFCISSRF
jgi:hypothetical protein